MPVPTHHPLLALGLCQAASDALRKLNIPATRILQTIGSAPASKGVHLQDGLDDFGHKYTAALDLRTRDLKDEEIKKLLSSLANVGFAGWARRPGHDHWPAEEAPHLHCVFSGIPMKRQLRSQLHQWCHSPTLNGLASEAPYVFWQPTRDQVQLIQSLFLKHNPPEG